MPARWRCTRPRRRTRRCRGPTASPRGSMTVRSGSRSGWKTQPTCSATSTRHWSRAEPVEAAYDDMTKDDATCEKPVVGVSACAVELDGVPNHVCRANYVRRVADAGCVPILLPAVGPLLATPELLGMIDGLVLTGSASNV